MKASIILAHPFKESFNHAIFARSVKTFENIGIATFAHDLYAEKFNPILTVNELGWNKSEDPLVNKYSEELVESDYLVFIHPNWWGQPPAMLKGYIDRVFRPPHAYDMPEDGSGGGLPIEKLKGKYGIVFNTSNTPETRENNYFGDPLENEWIKCTFGFCGITDSYRKMFRIIADSDEEQRTLWLEEVEKTLIQIVSE